MPSRCDPAVYHYLSVSTIHIPKNDTNFLEKGPVIADANEYGWWILVPEEEDIADVVAASGLSDAMAGILLLASQQGCVWVRLDADAEIYEDLPCYDWDQS
jgi:ABC-type tungstate transport system permease subunit